MQQVDIVIRTDHPAFAGHFPGMPIIPGVVLLDEALWAISSRTGIDLDAITVTSIKFKSFVRPGQPLTLRYEPMPRGRYRFELMCAQRRVANGMIAAAAPD